jgi:alkaline phosphatase D
VLAERHRWERWGNLPGERRRLIDLIARTGAGRTLILSGDRHRAGLYRLAEARVPRLIEATSSSLNRSFDDPDETGPNQIGAMFGANNFGMIEIDWPAGLVTVSIRDENGVAQRAIAAPLATPD